MSLATGLGRRLLQPLRCHARHCVRRNFEGEYAHSQTSLGMVSKEDTTNLYVEAYSNQGFRLSNGFRIFGPCAVFPRSILHWNVKNAESINADSLSLICLLEPKLDLLVIGKGDRSEKVDFSIIRHLKMKNINVEVLPTDQACGTFNFLNSEGRYVAACLIPPKTVKSTTDEDLIYGSGKIPTDINIDPLMEKTPEEMAELEAREEEAEIARLMGRSQTSKGSEPLDSEDDVKK